MPKYLIDMPEGCHPIDCTNCPEYTRARSGCIHHPLYNAIEVNEIKSGFDICWGEEQAYDFHSRKPVTLYAVVKEANNGKV